MGARGRDDRGTGQTTAPRDGFRDEGQQSDDGAMFKVRQRPHWSSAELRGPWRPAGRRRSRACGRERGGSEASEPHSYRATSAGAGLETGPVGSSFLPGVRDRLCTTLWTAARGQQCAPGMFFSVRRGRREAKLQQASPAGSSNLNRNGQSTEISGLPVSLSPCCSMPATTPTGDAPSPDRPIVRMGTPHVDPR